MQTANVIVRLNGSLNNTVPKLDVTPAEVLVLQHIHGEDSVVDLRPTGTTKRRPEQEFNRLAALYDAGAGAFHATPAEERKSVLATLWPGVTKTLPKTFEEIGIGIATEAPVIVPDLPEATEDDPELGGDADASTIEAAHVEGTTGDDGNAAANEALAAD